MSRHGLALLALLLLPAAAPLPEVPVYRTFGRWFVACDNTRACVARGFPENTRVQLELNRKAGTGPATLTFSAEDRIVAADVRLDGAPLAFAAPSWSATDTTLTTKDPAAIAALVIVARNARALTLDGDAPTDRPPRTVPMDGFAAAVLLVDAVQGRPGTSTALIAPKGDAAPPAAPPVPRTPRWKTPPPLTQGERQRLTQQAGQLPSGESTPCDDSAPPRIYPLDAISALAIRPCFMAAYQSAAVVAVLPRAGGVSRPATGARPGMPFPRDDRSQMVDAEFVPASGTLFSSSKGRGIADCGSSEAWVWSTGAFRLKSLNYQRECGGTEPGDWPPLFRSR